MILPRDRSAAVRIGEPSIRSVVSYLRPVQASSHGGYRDVCAKGFVFIDRPRQRGGDGRGGGADGGAAVDGFAGSATGRASTASTGTSDATDISARRRHYRGGGGAAAAAAFAGIVGTGIAIAAAQNRRDYYDGGYGYYGGGPAYYGGPVYYGGGPLLRQRLPTPACPTIAGILSQSW